MMTYKTQFYCKCENYRVNDCFKHVLAPVWFWLLDEQDFDV